MTFRSSLVCAVALTVCLADTVAFANDLSIHQLRVEVRVEERLARTKMFLVAKNHTPRAREAHLDLALPKNASVTHLSMDLGLSKQPTLTRGRLIERSQAIKVYQEIVRRAKDPAILEDQGQGDYKLRVFPVPESGLQELVIEYEHLLPQQGNLASYVFAAPVLRDGAETISHFSLSVNGTTQHHEQFPSSSTVRVPFVSQILKGPQVHYAEHDGETYFRVDVVPEVEAPSAGRGYYATTDNALLKVIEEPLVTNFRAESRFGAVEGLSVMSEPIRQGQIISVYGRLTQNQATLSLSAIVGELSYRQDVVLTRRKSARNPSLVRAWMRRAPVEVAREVSGVGVLTATNAFLVAEIEKGRVHMGRAPFVSFGCGVFRRRGTLDRATIRRHVRLASKKVRQCYNRALRRDPTAEGTVVADWTIAPDGSVADTRVSGELSGGKLHACIAEIHQNMSFPPSSAGNTSIRVRYPYLLQHP